MHSLIEDDFLPHYNFLRKYADTAKFKTETNPVDGVEYPLICKNIPSVVLQSIAVKLGQFLGRPPNIAVTFLRLSVEGVHVPHIAHTDNSMGDYSLMLYLNDETVSGTTFLRHIDTGIGYIPQDESLIHRAAADQNNMDAWARVSTVPMKENRAVIFDAGYFHCAEPVGGFGTNQKNGRMVLTSFFS